MENKKGVNIHVTMALSPITPNSWIINPPQFLLLLSLFFSAKSTVKMNPSLCTCSFSSSKKQTKLHKAGKLRKINMQRVLQVLAIPLIPCKIWSSLLQQKSLHVYSTSNDLLYSKPDRIVFHPAIKKYERFGNYDHFAISTFKIIAKSAYFHTVFNNKSTLQVLFHTPTQGWRVPSTLGADLMASKQKRETTWSKGFKSDNHKKWTKKDLFLDEKVLFYTKLHIFSFM